VAAAHWLQAAVDVVMRRTGDDTANVLVEADDIEALPHATPTAVLELMEIGLSPTDAVTDMIRDAMAVAEGDAPDIDDLRGKIDAAEQLATRYGQFDPEVVAGLRTIRLTTLDPLRPARDMLEDLLAGIHGCWLVYREYADLNDDLSDDETGADVETAFRDEVRAHASADRHRLDLEDRKQT
jgi:hypothetical protein